MDSLERVGVLPEQILHNTGHFLDRAFAPLRHGTVDALAARDDLERDRALVRVNHAAVRRLAGNGEIGAKPSL